MNTTHKPLVWLHSEVKSPPFSATARMAAGYLLRRLQAGEKLTMPECRQMSVIGKRCHELRIIDAETKATWRIIHRIDDDAIVIAEVFKKKTTKTSKQVIVISKKRLKEYDDANR